MNKTVVLIIDDAEAAARANRAVLDLPDRPNVLVFASVGDCQAHQANLALEAGAHPKQSHLTLMDLRVDAQALANQIALFRASKCGMLSPLVVLVPSGQSEIAEICYRERANSVLTRPADGDAYSEAIHEVASYWLGFNQLPG